MVVEGTRLRSYLSPTSGFKSKDPDIERLSGGNIERLEVGNRGRFEFALHTTNGRAHRLRAATRAEFDYWMTGLHTWLDTLPGCHD